MHSQQNINSQITDESLPLYSYDIENSKRLGFKLLSDASVDIPKNIFVHIDPPDQNPCPPYNPITDTAPTPPPYTKKSPSKSASPLTHQLMKYSTALPVGCTGLNNLGNTCFMNSALQCLSNAVPLTEYFLLEKWKAELNEDNPLGMSGKVAEAYANLVSNLWKPNESRSSSFAPSHFKGTIGRFNSTFRGYAQQDSQELLNFLLDGLHEDLNRIHKKPYTEKPELDGMPDDHVHSKFWEIHKMRNDSIVVDLFQGTPSLHLPQACTNPESNAFNAENGQSLLTLTCSSQFLSQTTALAQSPSTHYHTNSQASKTAGPSN
jgi:hypothetical protein